MINEIFISLKPEFAELIKARKKTYEFRKYKPRRRVEKFWIYVNQPVAELKYVAQIDPPIEYPGKIPENGIGNLEFNNGLKKSKYAYPIIHFDEIIKPISHEELEEKFGFVPPQSFAYADKYSKIIKYVADAGLRRLF